MHKLYKRRYAGRKSGIPSFEFLIVFSFLSMKYASFRVFVKDMDP